ncbi:MAG: hypothetical protein Q9182_003776 [Xanthomendoza sp. 2 TL-2023]
MLPTAGDEIRWDFAPVFDLLESLSSAPTVQTDGLETDGDLSPSSSPVKLSTPTYSSKQLRPKSDLGNFDKLWAFLGQPLDLEPPEVPHIPLDEAHENNGLHQIIGKEVHWRDEVEGGELADNEEAGSNVSLLGLTKTQRKKLRRKQRKAASGEKPLHATLPTNTSEDDSEVEPRTRKRSPDRRAIIQQILQRSPKTPENGPLPVARLTSRSSLPIDVAASSVANTNSRATADRVALAAAAARKERLIGKLKERFIDDRQFLTNATMMPFAVMDNTGTEEGIHVFVDASNIMIGFHDSLKLSRGLALHSRIRRQPLSFHNLSLILERGRPVSKRVLVGSDNFAPIQEARLIGYETNILDRVHKAKELTPRQKKYSSNHHNASSGANGTSGGSGSETTAAARYAKEKWVEQAVDEILHLKILESVVDAKQPSTMVLATGDAAEAEYSQGFLRMVERALEKGWKVELVSFRKNTSGMYKRKEFRSKWTNKFKIVELDEFVDELLGFEG